MTLTSADLARLDAANRLLTSPLAAPSPEAWLREAGGHVRDLVRGSGVVLQLPTSAAPYFSDDAPGVASGVLDCVQEIQWDGVRFSDPVVDTWNRLRRRARLDAFGWNVNMKMVEEQGLDPHDSLIITEVLQGQRFHDFVGMIGETPEGEAMIWVLHHQYGAFPFGEQTPALLSVLMPAFRSGLDALTRLGAHRAALDALDEPLLALSPDGAELHRTPALGRLLADDPEAAAVELGLRQLGRQALALVQLGRADGPPCGEVTVATRRGTYTLRPTALPPGLFSPDPCVLVTVARASAPALPEPETIRQRHGLTKREAEVALLLTEGLSNAAMAERLFVSPHTARHHVENVLAKLEVSSRAAVATRLLAA